MDKQRAPSTQGVFTVSNGISFGATELAAGWGSFGAPIVPRAYRELYAEVDAPFEFKKLARNKGLVLADLGRSFWNRLPVSVITEPHRRVIAARLAKLPVPDKAIALPSGVPMGWVATLPLRTRTQNAVDRYVDEHGPGPLDRSLLVQDIMKWRSVGIGSLLDLLCVLESAELDGEGLQRVALSARGEPAHIPWNAAKYLSSTSKYLSDVAAWAQSETTAVTLGDVLALLVGTPTMVREWRTLAGLRLEELAYPGPHPYSVVDSWIGDLPEREARIFRSLHAQEGRRPTLQEVGDQVGLTRERIRQLDNIMIEDLRSFMQTEPGRAIRWRVDSIRLRLGVAAPVDRAQDLLTPPSGAADYSRLLLFFAGPYRKDGDWLLLRSAESQNPTGSILATADQYGRINMAEVREPLRRWGLTDELHLLWLTRDDRCRIVNGGLVRWARRITDHLAHALLAEHSPMTAEQMLEEAGLVRPVRSVRNALAADERFVRVNQTEWALAEWGHPEFTSIAESIRSLLAERGTLPVSEVVRYLQTTFGTIESSSRAYCYAPAFVIERGEIRLRRPDEPYLYSAQSLPAGRGVFLLAPSRIGLLFKIDQDTMRGSGRALGLTAGQALGVMPNDRLRFESDKGHCLTATFPDTSISGPALGTVRALVEVEDGKPGDFLNLVLDRSAMSVSATVTRIGQHHHGWDLVARLTGIDPTSGRTGLAASLGCEPHEVETILQKRGDHEVLRSIPGLPGK